MPMDIEPLTIHDITWAMRLVEQANWNQTPSDWRRILGNQAGGCFKAVNSSTPIGTVTTTRYGRQLAWIGMMLVDINYRRRGVGRSLMLRALAYLKQQDTATVQLDATPAGRPLYESLDFRALWDFQRWHRPALSVDELLGVVPPPHSNYFAARERLQKLRELDQRAFGIDRITWLARVAEDSQSIFRDDGFGMLRPGRMGSYLGPVVAANTATAQAIITELVQSARGPLIWDIFPHVPAHSDLARTLGFEPVRTLTRMALGEELPISEIGLQAALCDPASG